MKENTVVSIGDSNIAGLEILDGFNLITNYASDSLKSPGCYIVRHLATNSFYIGGTGNMFRRIKDHTKELHGGYHWNKEFQKYFITDKHIDFYFKQTTTIDEAFILEQEMLDKYFGKSNICNDVPNATSMKGFKHSDETKERMSVTRSTPEMKQYISNLNTGRKHTAETIEAIRASMIKRYEDNPITDEQRKAISDRLTGIPRPEEMKLKSSATKRSKSNPVVVGGIQYGSIIEAVEKTGIKYTTISERFKSNLRPDYYRLIDGEKVK